jgi:hypothetical protein
LISTTSARHALATSIDSKETRNVDITFYLCEPIQFEMKYCTIPLKCVQIDNPVKIFGFVKQLCGILKKPVEKINSYEIQWLRYFAIIINKISNFTGQQASSNLN